MGSTKRGTPANKSQGSRVVAGSQKRPSLPPKPVSQKRTRNSSPAAAMLPPPQASPSARSAIQKGWGRRSASWTPEEDAKLVELVKKESSIPPSITASKTWSRVAAQLTNRTGKQCRERYLNQLKPGIRRDPWSAEEERILRDAHARIGNKWVAIASQLPGRTDNCVKNHWNSMLRKRQRREAALKAAQAEAAATLGDSQQPRIEVDRRSDVDLSFRTGCATPSGVSSSYQDMQTSEVPSPYTASSPITPRRDSKLQISNLVAASTKELPNWSVPFSNRQFGSGGSLAENHGDAKSPDDHNIGHDMTVVAGVDITGNKVHPIPTSPQTLVQQPAVVRLSSQASRVLGTEGISQNASFMTKEVTASPMQCIASSPRLPQIMQNIQTERNRGGDVIQRRVRRSSRLLSSSTKEKENEISTVKDRMKGVQKKTINKSQSLNEGVGAHALVALAAAASSVPPSPLTPESRYSTTSRSRSVSPDPRLWPAQQNNCLAGSSRVGVRMTRRRAAELSDGVLKDGGQNGQNEEWKRENMDNTAKEKET